MVRERNGLVLLLGGILFPFFLVSDWVYFPEQIRTLASLRLAAGFCCLGFFWLNRKVDLGLHSFWLGFIGFYICAFAMTAIVSLTGGYRTSYYAGFLMIIVAFAALMSLPPRLMAPHLLIAYLVYMVVTSMQSPIESFALFFLSHFLVLVTVGICLVAAGVSHRLRVREYLSRKALEEAQGKLKKQARSLAARVTESRMRYRQLVERMNDCLGVSGPDGRIVYVNDRFCELLGYAREALLGRPFVHLAPVEIHEQVWEEFARRKKGIRSAYESLLCHKSGRKIPVIISAEALMDEAGEFQGSFAVITDISRQKEMEEALRATSERLRAILDATTDAVMLLDPDGGILDINASAAQTLEKSADELKGMCVESLWPPKVAACRLPMIRKVLERGAPLYFEEVCEAQTLSHHVYPLLGKEGGVISVALFSRDITVLKKAERRIAHLTHELLRALENERHRIARDLHDHVAQDLSSLRISFEDLSRMLEGHPAARRQASHISRRLQDAIRDLREIAYALRPPDLDTLGLPRTVYRYCQEFSEYTGIPVHFVSAGMETAVRDFDREINLYRLVQEALSNIRKHAGATQVDVRLIASHPEMIVRISDNGVGFDADNWDGAASWERGMGLKGMAERVALLGGRFEIRSKPGQGCRICVRIPMETSLALEGPEMSKADPQTWDVMDL